MRFFKSVLTLSLISSTIALQNVKANEFRFDGPYIFDSHLRSNGLFVGDFNGDGETDFGTVENSDGLMRLYLSTDDTESDLFNDQFVKKEILLEEVITTVSPLDANGDGADDIAMIGTDGELKIIYQNSNGELEPEKETNIEGSKIYLMDMNQDSLHDLIVEDGLVLKVFLQSEDGLNLDQEFISIYLSNSVYGHPRQADVNGDGLLDLIYDSIDERAILRVITQQPDHQYKVEKIVDVSSFYDYEFLRQDSSDVLVQIHSPTRRLNFISLETERDSNSKGFQHPEIITFNPDQESIPSSTILSDVNQDGFRDILTGVKDQAFLRVMMLEQDGQLIEKLIPSLTNIDQIAEVSIDGTPSYLLLSKEESLLAMTKWDEDLGRLTFPQPYNLTASPITFETGEEGDGTAIYLAVKDDESKKTTVHRFNPDQPIALSDESLVIEVQEKRELTRIKPIDLNLDNKTDLICFFDYKDPQVYLATDDDSNPFELLEENTLLDGLLKGIDSDQIKNLSWNGDEHSGNLVVRKEYARIFNLNDQGLTIDYQIIGPDPNVDYNQGVQGNFLNENQDSLVLLNMKTKQLEFFDYQNDSDFFEYQFNADPFTAFSSSDELLAHDLNGDGIDEAVVMSAKNIAVFGHSAETIQTKSLATYETETEDGGFGVVFLPDELVHTDIIPVLEMQEFSLEFLSLKDDTVSPDYRFKVFSREYQYRRRNPLDENPEPRGLTWGDFNGDGESDLMLLSHDKILIYLYEKTEKEISQAK